jgi:cytoskeletal protein RodZ
LNAVKRIWAKAPKESITLDPAPTTMESIGAYLKREREFRNITLDEISQATKIRETNLRALEEDRLNSLGSPVFVKGYLKACATYLGLDPNDLVLRYEASLREEKPPRVTKPVDETPDQWRLKYIVLPVSLLLIFGVLLLLVLQRPMRVEMDTQPVQETESTQGPALKSESTSSGGTADGDSPIALGPHREAFSLGPPPVHPPRPSASLASKSPLGIQLQLTALEDAWVQIQIDQEPAKEMLLRSGNTVSRQGEKSMQMKIGNAGGLEILWNGKDLGKLGESGQVIYLAISPEEVQLRRPGGSFAPIP